MKIKPPKMDSHEKSIDVRPFDKIERFICEMIWGGVPVDVAWARQTVPFKEGCIKFESGVWNDNLAKRAEVFYNIVGYNRAHIKFFVPVGKASKEEINEAIDKIKEQKLFRFIWTDEKVIDFVNWYINLHNLDFRYTIENNDILVSFKRGDDVSNWDEKL